MRFFLWQDAIRYLVETVGASVDAEAAVGVGSHGPDPFLFKSDTSKYFKFVPFVRLFSVILTSVVWPDYLRCFFSVWEYSVIVWLMIAHLLLEYTQDISYPSFHRRVPEDDDETVLYKQTPLVCAVRRDSPEFIAYLHKHGASVNKKIYHNATPLHVAALRGATKAMKMLMKLGAEVNAEDEQGMTPAHYCVALFPPARPEKYKHIGRWGVNPRRRGGGHLLGQPANLQDTEVTPQIIQERENTAIGMLRYPLHSKTKVYRVLKTSLGLPLMHEIYFS
jgi:hypothetical protein